MKPTLLSVVLLMCLTTMTVAQLQWINLSNITVSGNNTLTSSGACLEDSAFSVNYVPAGSDGYLQVTTTAGDL